VFSIYKNNTDIVSDYDKKKYIGKIFSSNNYGDFKVTGVHSKKGGRKYFICYFLDTGFERVANSSDILKGSIKDYSLIYLTEKRVCSICKIEKELTLENFERYKTVCRKCKSKQAAKRRRKKRSEEPAKYYSKMLAS
jgi:hypothetical protein